MFGVTINRVNKDSNIKRDKFGIRLYEFNCQQCQKIFLSRKSQKNKFCSTSCMGTASRKPLFLKNCQECEKEYLAPRNNKDQKFCSTDCMHKNRIGADVTLNCIQCKNEYIVPYVFRNKRKFCSQACMGQHFSFNRSGENSHMWEGGKSKRPAEQYRIIRALKKERGKCEECGSTKKLQGHHKLPYAQYPELGSDPNNIQILCAPCHALKHPELASFILKKQAITGVILTCQVCSTEYYRCKSKAVNSKTCSYKCAGKLSMNIRKRRVA